MKVFNLFLLYLFFTATFVNGMPGILDKLMGKKKSSTPETEDGLHTSTELILKEGERDAFRDTFRFRKGLANKTPKKAHKNGDLNKANIHERVKGYMDHNLDVLKRTKTGDKIKFGFSKSGRNIHLDHI